MNDTKEGKFILMSFSTRNETLFSCSPCLCCGKFWPIEFLLDLSLGDSLDGFQFLHRNWSEDIDLHGNSGFYKIYSCSNGNQSEELLTSLYLQRSV